MLKRPKFKSEVPQKDDKLFKKGDDRQLNAQIDNNNLNFDSYARGYKKAADILVEHIKDEQQDINLLVFSIVFLYRQCIELRLKDIINKGKELFGLSKDIPKHHDINRLWEECREIADKTISYISYGFDRKILNDLIKQFMDVDKISTTFRYPVDKKDNLSFKKR